MPKYPIYIPSLGRVNNCKTMQFLDKFGIQYYIVPEAHEADQYQQKFPKAKILSLPGRDYGCVSFARNFIKNTQLIMGINITGKLMMI